MYYNRFSPPLTTIFKDKHMHNSCLSLPETRLSTSSLSSYSEASIGLKRPLDSDKGARTKQLEKEEAAGRR